MVKQILFVLVFLKALREQMPCGGGWLSGFGL